MSMENYLIIIWGKTTFPVGSLSSFIIVWFTYENSFWKYLRTHTHLLLQRNAAALFTTGESWPHVTPGTASQKQNWSHITETQSLRCLNSEHYKRQKNIVCQRRRADLIPDADRLSVRIHNWPETCHWVVTHWGKATVQCILLKIMGLIDRQVFNIGSICLGVLSSFFLEDIHFQWKKNVVLYNIWKPTFCIKLITCICSNSSSKDKWLTQEKMLTLSEANFCMHTIVL